MMQKRCLGLSRTVQSLTFAAACAGAALVLTPTAPARAQAIVLSVNGDPVTSLDLEERMKLLRALHRPASREAATESMIEDRLKLHEASRFGVNLKDSDIGEEVQTLAKKYKMSPQAMMAAINHAGVSNAHAVGYFKSRFAYTLLVRALNRGVEASEIAVRDELAKEKGKSNVTTYTIRQIVFTFNPDAPPSVVEASVKQAQALRGRFTSCETGIPYAKSLPGVAVREKLTRTSTQLGDGARELLDKTPTGHLTEPSRSPNGIELVAVCNKTATKDDEELRKVISERLLAEHFAAEEEAKYKDMRSRAVISHPQ